MTSRGGHRKAGPLVHEHPRYTHRTQLSRWTAGDTRRFDHTFRTNDHRGAAFPTPSRRPNERSACGNSSTSSSRRETNIRSPPPRSRQIKRRSRPRPEQVRTANYQAKTIRAAVLTAEINRIVSDVCAGRVDGFFGQQFVFKLGPVAARRACVVYVARIVGSEIRFARFRS